MGALRVMMYCPAIAHALFAFAVGLAHILRPMTVVSAFGLAEADFQGRSFIAFQHLCGVIGATMLGSSVSAAAFLVLRRPELASMSFVVCLVCMSHSYSLYPIKDAQKLAGGLWSFVWSGADLLTTVQLGYFLAMHVMVILAWAVTGSGDEAGNTREEQRKKRR
eukprot:Hpha_TRINITY_DN28372_c0_g1::TRINITY_DN28372_c0_g1_i1::g.2326::m.2326